MTPIQKRVEWYRHMAGECGDAAISLVHACREVNENGIEAAANFAREAGHYGNLAMDYEACEGKQLILMSVRTTTGEVTQEWPAQREG